VCRGAVLRADRRDQSLVECERHAERHAEPLCGQRLSYESCPIKWSRAPLLRPTLCTAQDRHSVSFVRYLWGPAGPKPQPEAGKGLKDKSEPARVTSKLSQPTNFSALATWCAGCATLLVVIAEYLWLSHSASKIVSDNVYEEPHDNAALSLHRAAPAPARVNSNERPSLASAPAS
jgi:hypothetical protein